MKTIFVIRPDDIAKYGPGLLALIGVLFVGLLYLAGFALCGAAVVGILYGLWLALCYAVELLADGYHWFMTSRIYLFGWLLIPLGIIYGGWKLEQRKTKH